MAGKEDYVEIFKLADKDTDGMLTYQELLDQMRKFGYKGNDDLFKVIFSTSKKGETNSLKLEEFLKAMSKAPPIVHKVALLRKIFRDLDVEKQGAITRKEIGSLLERLGHKFTKKDMDNMMLIIDKNNNQKIELEEFIQAFMDFKETDDQDNPP